jgi:glucose/arabinose dehydrogenase
MSSGAWPQGSERVALAARHGRSRVWRVSADVLAFDPEGRGERVYATGIRNCSGLAAQPGAGALWCVVNERGGLGDELPPDYVTHVAEGAFYGWPGYYLGDHQDPHHKG